MTGRTFIGVGVWLVGAVAWAESRPVSLSLEEALARAETAPEVKGRLESAKRRSAFRAPEAGAVSLPQLTVQPGFRLFSESDRGPELQVSYLHPFSTADLGGARLGLAKAESKVLEAEAAVLRRERRRQVVDAWMAAWAAGSASEQAEAEWKEAQSLRERVGAGVAHGALVAVELAEAQSYEAEARLAVLHAEGMRFEAWLALGRAVGEGPGAAVMPSGPLPSVAALQPVETPELAYVDASLAVVDAARDERVAHQAPQLGLGGILQRESPSGAIGFLSAQVTLPVLELGVTERAAESAARATLEGDRIERAADVAHRIALARHEVEHKREELAVAKGELLPAVEQAVQRRDDALSKGAGTVQELSMARRRRVAALARVVLLESEVARALWMLAEYGEAPEGPQDARGGPR